MVDTSSHYVKNQDFAAALKEWRNNEYLPWKARRDEAKLKGEKFTEPKPTVNNYIGQCFYLIAKKYARRPNWSGYTYIDDMISEGILLCVKYAHNFDPEKSNNAFAYFTRIAHNGFLQVINRENKFAKFKFQMAKEQSAKLSKMDYNNIILEDEDNVELEQLESDSEDDVKEEPDYEKVAEASFFEIDYDAISEDELEEETESVESEDE